MSPRTLVNHMKIRRLANGSLDLESVRAHANWTNLSEIEKLLLTFVQWDWDRLTEEVKAEPDLATVTWGDGETLLCIAAHDNQPALSRLLVERGADVNAKSSLGSPLYCAVWSGNPEIVGLLLDSGASSTGTGENGETPLHLAVRKGYTDIVDLLLHRGVDVNATDKNGLTPLDKAAEMRLSRIEETLLRHHATGRDR